MAGTDSERRVRELEQEIAEQQEAVNEAFSARVHPDRRARVLGQTSPHRSLRRAATPTGPRYPTQMVYRPDHHNAAADPPTQSAGYNSTTASNAPAAYPPQQYQHYLRSYYQPPISITPYTAQYHQPPPGMPYYGDPDFHQQHTIYRPELHTAPHESLLNRSGPPGATNSRSYQSEYAQQTALSGPGSHSRYPEASHDPSTTNATRIDRPAEAQDSPKLSKGQKRRRRQRAWAEEHLGAEPRGREWSRFTPTIDRGRGGEPFIWAREIALGRGLPFLEEEEVKEEEEEPTANLGPSGADEIKEEEDEVADAFFAPNDRRLPLVESEDRDEDQTGVEVAIDNAIQGEVEDAEEDAEEVVGSDREIRPRHVNRLSGAPKTSRHPFGLNRMASRSAADLTNSRSAKYARSREKRRENLRQAKRRLSEELKAREARE